MPSHVDNQGQFSDNIYTGPIQHVALSDGQYGYEAINSTQLETSLQHTGNLAAQENLGYSTFPSQVYETAVESPVKRKRNERMYVEGPVFTQTNQVCRVFNSSKAKSYSIRLVPKIDRGFFVADGEWTYIYSFQV